MKASGRVVIGYRVLGRGGLFPRSPWGLWLPTVDRYVSRHRQNGDNSVCSQTLPIW